MNDGNRIILGIETISLSDHGMICNRPLVPVQPSRQNRQPAERALPSFYAIIRILIE
jgi:hypothetical protein